MKHADRLNAANQHQAATKLENERHARLADRTILVLVIATLAGYLWVSVLGYILQIL